MNIDCKCYFWERKVGATLVGGLFFGVVYGSMTAYSDQEPTMILCYSLLLGLSTATFLGDILSKMMASQFDTPWPSAVNMQAILSGLMMGMMVGISFGFLPANQAARMTPIDAIRNK